jgi:hypothetical protein
MPWISGIVEKRRQKLEQNHGNRASKSFVQGIEFLRKSILCGFGIGYIYRDFAVAAGLLRSD